MCHGDPKTAMVILYPMVYKGVAGETVMKRQRQLEDMCITKQLSMNHKFSLHYVVPQEHQNDRRYLGQEARLCISKNDSSPWEETTAARGRFPSEVSLVRVRDMVNPGRSPADADKSLGPADRVTQRGVEACRTILKGLVQGLILAPGAKLVVASLSPSRVDEFAAASWKLVKEDQFDLAYSALTTSQTQYEEQKANMMKMLMEEWWGECSEAGPREPPAVRPQEDEAPTLRLATWTANNPTLPGILLDKFEDGTPQRAEVLKGMEQFWSEFGNHAPNSLPRMPGRLGNGPQYDEDEKFDITKEIILTTKAGFETPATMPFATWRGHETTPA